MPIAPGPSGPAGVAPATVIQTGAGSPYGVVTPTQTGALYQNLTDGSLYSAQGATSLDWVSVGGSISGGDGKFGVQLTSDHESTYQIVDSNAVPAFRVRDPTNASTTYGILTTASNTLDDGNGGGATFGGQVSVQAATLANSAPVLSQLSSFLTIVNGALPNTGAWVSGTAKQNPVAQDITVNVVVVMDGTANAASCTIGISPDNTTYTTIGAPGVSAAINTVGAETLFAAVSLPNTWWIKLTLVHCTVAASVYY